MDYESLSTIVLVVIVAILMVSWLPRRTVQGMKQVIKHPVRPVLGLASSHR